MQNVSLSEQFNIWVLCNVLNVKADDGKPASPKLRDGDLAGPGPVHLVEYPGYHLQYQYQCLQPKGNV